MRSRIENDYAYILIILFDIKDRPNHEEKTKDFIFSSPTYQYVTNQIQSISQLFINFALFS